VTVAEAKAGIAAWLTLYTLYKEARQHQSLGYRANLRGRPVNLGDGFAKRLRFPRFPSKLDKQGMLAFAHPHSQQTIDQVHF
jgi:hypothetical protein